MARPATGQVKETPNAEGISFAIRFRAYGKRYQETVGHSSSGYTRADAKAALRHVLADVERKIWQPPAADPVAREVETFHEFASAWYAEREPDWSEASCVDVKGALQNHLLPTFADMRLDEITIEDVDRFSRSKRAEGRLGNNSINKVIQHAAACMDQAVEWGRVPNNVFKGRKRRLPAEAPKRTWIEPEQLPTLLDAAKPRLRLLLAVLAGCGLRIGEAVPGRAGEDPPLVWGDVNLATQTIRVRDSKTPTGVRSVDIPVGLAEELRACKVRTKPKETDPVFRNQRGSGTQTTKNAEVVLKTALKAANVKLAEMGLDPIDTEVTPHSFRRLFASLRFGVGDDVVYVAEMLGHTSPTFSMEKYAKAIRRRSRLTGTHLAEFDKAIEWARMGTNADLPNPETPAIPDLERGTAHPVV